MNWETLYSPGIIVGILVFKHHFKIALLKLIKNNNKSGFMSHLYCAGSTHLLSPLLENESKEFVPKMFLNMFSFSIIQFR